MINKAILVGNVGGDPDIRSLENDAKVATFSLATTERFSDKNGQRQERTEWHRIVAWRNLAGIVEQYVHKGTQVYIEGRITYRQYKDKDGNDRTSTEIVASDLKLLGKNPNSHGGSVSEPQQSYSQSGQQISASASEPVDDLPF